MSWGTYRQDFKEEDMTEVPTENGGTRLVCPLCKNHKQMRGNEAHDCKNLFTYVNEYGRTCTGQCGCYSAEHGLREGEWDIG